MDVPSGNAEAMNLVSPRSEVTAMFRELRRDISDGKYTLFPERKTGVRFSQYQQRLEQVRHLRCDRAEVWFRVFAADVQDGSSTVVLRVVPGSVDLRKLVFSATFLADLDVREAERLASMATNLNRLRRSGELRFGLTQDGRWRLLQPPSGEERGDSENDDALEAAFANCYIDFPPRAQALSAGTLVNRSPDAVVCASRLDFRHA